MGASYLVEIRLGGEIKSYLREIIRDIADRFGVTALVESHYVPHISLYGPFQTTKEKAVLARLRSLCEDYDLVPYRLKGFDHFDDDTIYVDVHSSLSLRKLRYRLSEELQPITYDEQEYDHDRWCKFHSTVARNINNQFQDIWEFVTAEYDVEYDGYVERVTLIRNGNIVKEYSVPQGRFLGPEAATSRPAWKRDEKIIEQHQRPEDHKNLVSSQPGFVQKTRTCLSDRFLTTKPELRRNSKFSNRKARTFVTGDLHLNHANIIEYCDRPFESVYEMNQQLITNWNKTVGPDDTVVFLGDLAFYYGTITTHDWLHALNGEVIFIQGNHDDDRTIDYHDSYILETDNRKYYCTHRPEDVPDDWNGWVIHGHKHNNATDRYPFVETEAQRINVAPELTEYRPVSVSELETTIETTSSPVPYIVN